jgi:hypothetical protein
MEAGDTAEKDPSLAWIKAEAASRELRTAGAEGWHAAKTASRELADAWDKSRARSE